MDELRPISNVRISDLQDAVREALRDGFESDVIADWVSSIDWSGTDTRRPPIADLVGRVEGWAAQYADGDMSRSEYATHLLALLPTSGKVVITAPVESSIVVWAL